MSRSTRLNIAFFCFAILLHWAALWVFESTGRNFDLALSPQKVLPPQVVELFDDKRPIARSSDSDEQTDAKAQYRAERRNRVKEQTQSPRHGAFQEQQALSQSSPPSEEGEGEQRSRSLSLSDLMALSQNPYRLDDTIREGNDTVLNTEGLAYAGFMNRISDAIYPSWVRHLREATEELGGADGKSSLAGGNFITRLGVEMDTKGNIVSMQILKSSGVAQIDDAPKSAFWDHEPFQNPPLQMFASNETTVRFVYEFHFEWKKSFFSILSL